MTLHQHPGDSQINSQPNSQPVWFDSHAHLQSESFAGDWQDTVDRAAAQHVCRILLPSSDYEDACRAIRLVQADERLVCSVGCHPHEAGGFSARPLEDWHALVTGNRSAPIVAIGEIGLDYHYDFSPRPIQRQVFRQQMEMARHLDLPLIIHDREATADCLNELERAAADGLLRSQPGVFHCFSGSVETARIVLSMGFYLGFDGPVTFKNAKKALAVIEQCPHDRLLIETDSPYLTPVPYRGRRNEPAFLPLIGAKVAEIWGLSPILTAELTTANAERLFAINQN